MATLSFAATDRKVFTPVSSALANLSNGAGTIIVLVKVTATGSTDYGALTDSGSANYYHALSHSSTTKLLDDENHTGPVVTGTVTQDTSNWWLYAVDWPGTGAALERFHWRNQTALGSWTHSDSTGNNGGQFAGPGTSGWLRVGYIGDNSTGTKLMGLMAVYAGTRFSDSDYGSWTKTSDIYNHALGHPTFLTELNATTLSDLIGGSTYSSANSSGTALTGADPDNWTLDGVGGGAVYVPQRRSQRPGWRPGMGPRNLVERRWPVTVGGQTYTITPNGVIAPAGAIAKAVTAPKAGAITPTGTPSKTAQKALIGTVSPTGALALAKVILKALAGAISPAGALARSTSKPLTGSAAPTGALTRSTAKALAGVASPTGAISKLTQKLLSGTVTPAGALALARVILKGLAGAISPAGALTKSTSKPLTGSAAPTGALTRSTAKALAGALSPAGALAKLASKRASGAITPAGALSLTRVILRSFAGTITPAGALVRQAAKQVGGATTPTGTIRRAITKTLTAAVAPAGALAKFTSRRIGGAIAPAGSVARQVGAAVWTLLRLRSWDHRAITTKLRDHRAVSTELRDHQADDTETSEH